MSGSAHWRLTTDEDAKWREELPNFTPLVARLLWNRGVRSPAAAETFLNPSYARDVHNPFLFRDMARACDRIADAIENQEKIFVHGDYDADGICAAAILTGVLKLLGADAEGFIPHRELDGYGMRSETVNILAAQNARLIITCDCGISNADEIAHAAAKNIDVIVTDHHTIPDKLPKAHAILHPKIAGETYPDQSLSGGGVAFKLMQGLLYHERTKKFIPAGTNIEGYEKWQLDLVAISSVADMVPLVGETRTLVRYGCVVLNKTRRPGLRAILQNKNGTTAGSAITPQTIAFRIAPRLNAAGRMDHGKIAFELLLTKNAIEAARLAALLETHNTNRQKLVDGIVKEARARIVRDALHLRGAIVVANEGWPAGVLGLIASRLKDEFYKPVFAIGINDGRIVGSGRSINEWDMIAALQTAHYLFLKFGGHPQACGFSLPNIETISKFSDTMHALSTNALAHLPEPTPTLVVDAQIQLHELTWNVWDALSRFEPFGVGNPEPKFLAECIELMQATPVGADNKHARLMVKNGTPEIKKIMAFGLGARLAEFSARAQFNGILSLGAREWNGTRELELKLHDFKIISL